MTTILIIVGVILVLAFWFAVALGRAYDRGKSR
jgi:hypothetical protein